MRSKICQLKTMAILGVAALMAIGTQAPVHAAANKRAHNHGAGEPSKIMVAGAEAVSQVNMNPNGKMAVCAVATDDKGSPIKNVLLHFDIVTAASQLDTSGGISIDSNDVTSNNLAQAIVHVTGNHPNVTYPYTYYIVVSVKNNTKVFSSISVVLQPRSQSAITTSCPTFAGYSLIDRRVNPKSIRWYTNTEFGSLAQQAVADWNKATSHIAFRANRETSQSTADVVFQDMNVVGGPTADTNYATTPSVVRCNLYRMDGNPFRKNRSYAPPSSEEPFNLPALRHEIGHFLGLNHNTGSPASLLYNYSSYYWVYGTEQPTSDTLNAVNALYP